MRQVGGVAIFADAEVSAFVDNIDVVVLAHLAHQFSLKFGPELRLLSEVAQPRLAHLAELLLPSPQNTANWSVDERVAHCCDGESEEQLPESGTVHFFLPELGEPAHDCLCVASGEDDELGL